MDRISRHYTVRDLTGATFETKVAIYEGQIRGWFHDPARIIERVSNSAGFVLLLICLSYVEQHALFYKGKTSSNQSRAFFRDAFQAIFRISPDATRNIDQALIDQALDHIYDQVRCGLFHVGLTRDKVRLSGDYDNPVRIDMDPESKAVLHIGINPHLMLNVIEDHLSAYVCRLRNGNEQRLRENFEKAWDIRPQMEKPTKPSKASKKSRSLNNKTDNKARGG